MADNENIFVENRDEDQILNSLMDKQPVLQASDPLNRNSSWDTYMDIPSKNKYGINLTEKENEARTKGYNDSALGVYHTNWDDVQKFKSSELAKAQESSETPSVVGTNYLKEDYSLSTSSLYDNILGRTQYEDLKYKCGLAKDESFTDYYNRTGYVPAGYEKEAKLLLAEERRMALYQKHLDGEMSDTDFLYEAYGKDLLKAEGVDFESQLYWYNRHKQGDYSNPLDSDTFLEQVINNARQIFEAEEWFKATYNKKLESTLAGIVIGTELDNDTVYSLFQPYIDALKPYFDDDVNKVITYYQAGAFSNSGLGVFNPFIDIDGDGKYDYYYHLNGKMYAVEGSSGAGDKTCKVEYGDKDANGNPTIKKVEVNEGITGTIGGFFEGIGQFFKNFADLGGLIYAGFSAIDPQKTFADAYQDYQAAMQRTFSDQDVVVFDGDRDLGYEIARGIGSVTAQIIMNIGLAVLTGGTGNAAMTAGQVAKDAAISAVKYAVIGAAAGGAVGGVVGAATGQSGNGVANSAIRGAVIGASLGSIVGVSGSLSAAQAASAKAIAEGTAVIKPATVFTKGLAWTAKLVGFVTKANSGAVFSGATLGGRFANAAILAAKDMMFTYINLATANRVLDYYENEHPESGVKKLSDGDIAVRTVIAGGTDIIISGIMRLMGSHGIRAFGKEAKLKAGKSVDYFGEEITADVFKGMDKAHKAMILNGAKDLPTLYREVGIDNIFDIVENLITMSTTAAVQNPYAKPVFSKGYWETFGKAMVSPQAIIQNLYITARNTMSYKGNVSTFRQRIQSMIVEEIPSTANAGQTLLSILSKYATDSTSQKALQEFGAKYAKTRGVKQTLNGETANAIEDVKLGQGNPYENDLDAIELLDTLLTPDVIDNLSDEAKMEIAKTFGLSKYTTSKNEDKIDAVNKKALQAFNDFYDNFKKSNKGFATSIIFYKAAKENASEIISMNRAVLKEISRVAENEKNNYKTIFFGGIKNCFKDPKERGLLELEWKTMQKWLKQNMHTDEMRAAVDYVKFEYLIGNKIDTTQIDALRNLNEQEFSKICKMETASDVSLFDGRHLDLVKKDGSSGYEIQWNEGEEGIPFLIAAFKDPNAIRLLNNFGLIKLEQDTDGSYTGFTMNKKTPWLIFSKIPEANNEILKNPEYSSWFDAIEDVCKLSTTVNEAGETLINSESPLMIKIELPAGKNSDGKETTKAYYIIAPHVASSSIEGINGIESARATISAMYTIHLAAKNSLSEESFKQSVMQAVEWLGWTSFPNFVNNLNDTKNATEEDHATARLFGIAHLLEVASDIKSSEETKGINRSFLIRLFSNDDKFNVIHPKELQQIIDNYNNDPKTSGFNKRIVEQAQALQTYGKKLQDLESIRITLKDYSDKLLSGKEDIKIAQQKINELKTFVTEVHKTPWLKQALINDKAITSKLLLQMLDNPEDALPFLGELEDLALSLTPSISGADVRLEDKIEAKNKLQTLLKSMLDESAGYFRNAFGLTTPKNRATTMFRKALYSQLNSSYQEVNTALDNYKVSKQAFKNLGEQELNAISSVIETGLGIDTSGEKLKSTQDNPNQPLQRYAIKITDPTIRTELETALMKFDSNFTFDGLAELFDDMKALRQKYVPELTQLLKDRESYEEDNAALIGYLASRLNLINDKYNYTEESNIIEMFRLYKDYYVALSEEDRPRYTDDYKLFQELYDGYLEKSIPITSRRTLLDVCELFYTNLNKYSSLRSTSRSAKATNLTTLKELSAFKAGVHNLLNLEQDELAAYMRSPIDFLNKKIADLDPNDEHYDFYKASYEALKSGKLDVQNPDDAVRLAFAALDPEACASREAFINKIKSPEPSTLKDYVNALLYSTLDLTDKPTDIPVYRISDDGKVNGRDLFDIILENKPVFDKLISYKPSEYLDKIYENIVKYNHFLYEGTDTFDAPNVIEVNIYDLMPAKMQEFYRKVSQSAELREKLETASQLQDISRITDEILKDTNGNLQYQLNFYSTFITEALDAGKTIYRIDVNDAKQVSDFRKTLEHLGYDYSQFNKLISGEPNVIPGVSYRVSSETGISIKVDSTDFFSKFAKSENFKPQLISVDSSVLAQRGFKYVLENAFGSRHSINADTKLHLFDADGKPILVSTIPSTNKETFTVGKFLEQAIKNYAKKGTIAGAGSGKTYILNRSISYANYQADPKAERTYKLLQIINGVQEFMKPDSKITANKNTSLQVRCASEEDAKSLYNISFVDPTGKTHSIFDGNSLFIATDIEEDNGYYIVSYRYNPKFDFDTYKKSIQSVEANELGRILPILTDLADYETAEPINSETQSIFGYIFKLGIEGISSKEDLLKFTQSRDKSIYSLDEEFYKSAITNMDGKSAQAILNKISEDQYKNNYYCHTLKAVIEDSSRLNEIDEDDDFKLLNNHYVRAVLAQSLDDKDSTIVKVLEDTQKTVAEADAIINSEDDSVTTEQRNQATARKAEALKLYQETLKQFTDAVIRLYNSASEDSTRSTAEQFKEFQRISSDSISLFKPEEKVGDLDAEQLSKEIDLFLTYYLAKQNAFTTTGRTLYKHNSTLSALGVLDEAPDNTIYINLERLAYTSSRDREALFTELNRIKSEYEAEGNTNSAKQISNAIDTLTEKIRLLQDLDALKDANESYTTSVIAGTAEPSQVTTSITRTYLSDKEDLNPYMKNLLIEMADGRFMSKTGFKKFIASSSYYDSNTDYSPLVRVYMDLIDQKLYQTVDKQGHTLVYNMNSSEAIGAFFNSIISCADRLLDLTITVDGKEKPLFDFSGDKDINLTKALMLAMDMNLYSTGVTHDAERAGALMVVWKDDGSSFEVKPIITSSTVESRSIIKELRLGDYSFDKIRSDKTHHYALIQLDKNSFMKNISGMSSGIKVYDLNDERVLDRLEAIELNNVLEWSRTSRDLQSETTITELFKEYYSNNYFDMPTYRDSVNQLIELFVDLGGVDRRVAQEAVATIQSIHSANETTWSEEAVNQILVGYGIDLKDRVDNKQLVLLRDIIMHGITHQALSEESMLQIKNYRNRLADQMSDKAFDIATDPTHAGFDTLSDDEQKLVARYICASRLRGGDLEFMLGNTKMPVDGIVKKLQEAGQRDVIYTREFNSETGKFEYKEWQYKGDEKDITAYNAISKLNYINFDLEWLYRLNNTADMNDTYQLSFKLVKHNGTEDEVVRYNILVQDPLLKNSIQDDLKSPTNSADTLYHTDKTFSDKKFKAEKFTGAYGVEESVTDNNGITVINIMVKSSEDAVNYLNKVALDNNIKLLVGFNNTAKDSDNDRIAAFKSGQDLLSRVNVLDIRKLAASTETNNLRVKLQARDNLQSYVDRGIIEKGFAGAAHDALSDIDTAENLYKFLSTQREDVTKAYTETYDDIVKLFNGDEQKAKSALSFDDFDSSSIRIKGNSIYDPSKLNRSQASLRLMLNAENMLNEYSDYRAANRQLHTELQNRILGDSKYRSDGTLKWYSNVKDKNMREGVSTIIAKLLLRSLPAGSALVDMNEAQIRAAYYSKDKDKITVMSVFDEAIEEFSHTLSDSKLTKEEVQKLFFSQSLDEMLPYINRAAKIEDPNSRELITDSKDEKYINTLNRRDILKNGKSILDIIADENTINLFDIRQSQLNNMAKGMIQSMYTAIKSIDGYDKYKAFYDIVLDNMLKFIGTPDGKLSADLKNKRFNIAKLHSKKFEDVAKFFVDVMNPDNDYYISMNTLYKMATEDPDLTTDSYGVVRIGSDVLDKVLIGSHDRDFILHDEATGEDYFYSEVWRQPGYNTTSVLKVIVDTKNRHRFSMSRTTSQTFFNGDFDGDHYFLKSPSKGTTAYGQYLYNRTVAGGRLLDIFKDVKYDADVTSVMSDTEKYIVNNHLGDIKNHLDELYKIDPNDRDASTKILKEYGNLQDDILQWCRDANPNDDPETIKSKADLMMSLYGVELINNAETSNTKTTGYIIFTRNQNYKQNASREIRQRIEEAINQRCYNNHYSNVLESQIIGQMGKRRIPVYNGAKLSDVLFTPDIALTQDTLRQLTYAIKKTPDLVSKATDYINTLEDLSAEQKTNLISLATQIDPTKDVAAIEFVGLMQRIQQEECSTGAYRSMLNKVTSEVLPEAQADYRNKVKAFRNFLNDSSLLPVGDSTTEADIDRMSGPAVMQYAASLVKSYANYAVGDIFKVRYEGSTTTKYLFNSLLQKGDIDVTNSRNCKVIAPKDLNFDISENDNNTNVSFGKIKVLVLTGQRGTTLSDSAIATDYCELNLHEIASLDIHNRRTSFDDLINKDSIDGSELLSGNRLTNQEKKLINPNYTYKIEIDKTRGVMRILSQNKVTDAIRKAGPQKFSNVTGKTLKFTSSTIEGKNAFKATKENEAYMPDFVISETAFNKEKLSAFANYKRVGSVSYGVSDGKDGYTFTDDNGKDYTYDVYEVDGTAFLDAWHLNDDNTKDRTIDRITVLNSIQGMSSFLNYGSMCIEFNDKGEAVFNTEGFRALDAAWQSLGQYDAYGVNAADEINIIRIASLLTGLDENTQKDFIADLGIRGNTQEALLQLYGDSTIGGDRGDAIVDKLINMYVKRNLNIQERINSNPLYKTVWAQDIDHSRNHIFTGSDMNEDALRSKNLFSTNNLKYNEASLRSTLGNEMIRQADSRQDLTSFYYDRLQLLEDFYSAASGQRQHLSRGDFNELAYRDGQNIFTEQVIPGTMSNFGHSIKLSNSKYLGAFTDDGLNKKTGQLAPSHAYVSNDERFNNTGYIPEAGEFFEKTPTGAIDKYYLSSVGKYKNPDDAKFEKIRTASEYKLLTPFMSLRGDDAEISDIQSQYKARFAGQLFRSSVMFDNGSNTLQIGSEQTPIFNATAQSYKQTLTEVNGSAKRMTLFSENIKSTNYKLSDVANGPIVSRAEKIAEYMNSKEFSFDAAVRDILKDIGDNPDDILNNSQVTLNKNLINKEFSEEAEMFAYRLGAKDNGVELVNSIFRSWGYKAKDGKDISLGQRTLYLNNQVKQRMSALLGDEYKQIVVSINKDTQVSNILNEYLDADYKISVYETIIKNKDKMLKQLGETQYNKYAEAAKELLVGKNSPISIDDAYKSLQKSMAAIKANKDFKLVLDKVEKINLRLLEQAQKYNPYEMLGYYMPMYLDTSGKKQVKSALPMYIASWNIKTNSHKTLLNAMTKDAVGNLHLASKLYTEDEGYIGMVSRVAQQFAVTETLRSLNTMLREDGWMRNLEIFSMAQKVLNDSLNTEFINSFEKLKLSKARLEYDRFTYERLRDNIFDAIQRSIPTSRTLTSASDFVKLYNAISTANSDTLDRLGISSRQELEQMYMEAKSVSSPTAASAQALEEAIRINDVYQNTISVMLNILEENGGASANDILVKIYQTVEANLKNDGLLKGYTLVDSRGAKLDGTKDVDVTPTALTLSIDDTIFHERLRSGNRQAEIAKMMLTGDIYLMKDSVADQLMSKVFTERQPGIIGRIFNKAKSYITGYIMATPLELASRMTNFTMFDIGALMSADAKAAKYLGTSMSTIAKYVLNPDNITEEAINTDKNLQILLRYMASTGQAPIDNNIYQGDEFKVSNIPVIKQWMKFASNALASQQFYVRLAYFMDLVLDGEQNDFNLDPSRFGVAFHLQKGLKEINADNSAAAVYRNMISLNDLDYYRNSDPDALKRIMNMDAAAVQVVAENVGVFGNMPYGSKWLSSRLGMMFTGFPMAGMRWGANRFQSLAYAFTNFEMPESRSYLMRNLGSTALTMAFMLALQALLSPDTMEYLKKRIKGKSKEDAEEEMGKDRMQNVENILFRGGCVKLFDTFIRGEEVTSAGQSQGMPQHLWNTYIADFILNKDQKFTDNLMDRFKQVIWGHQNAVLKDTIESIPGNKALQTYNWLEPSDNFFENIARKATGYLIGNAESKAFYDSMEATKNEDDTDFIERLAIGAKRAFVDNATGIHEYKSEFRNYKKAFSVVYNYKQLISPTTDEYYTSENYTDIKSEIMNALQNKASASAIYNIIEKYTRKGVPIGTIRSAVQSCSLRSKLLELGDVRNISQYMSEQEMAVIKSALAYEDYMFPYLSTIYEEIDNEYDRQKALTSNKNTTTQSLSSLLYQRNKNLTSKAYGNSNYSKYNQYNKYFNNYAKNYNYSSNQLNNPTETLEQFRKNYSYTPTTDIYGNRYTRYNNKSGQTFQYKKED